MIIDPRESDTGSEIAEFAAELSETTEQQTARLGGSDVQELPVSAGAEARRNLAQNGSVDAGSRNLEDIIAELPVTLKVVLGTARMPVASVSKLSRGTVVRLDNKVGDPVDIYVNGRLLARGQVVVLDEGSSQFGVTLTEIASPKSAKG